MIWTKLASFYSKHKKLILIITTIYLCVEIPLFLFPYFCDFKFTNTRLVNLIAILILPIPSIPFLWLTFLNSKKIKKVISIIYGVFLLPIYLIIILITLFAFFNFISNNGYRQVFEKSIDNKRYLIIYRTPDEGALGGDHICPAIVEKVFPGFQKRVYLDKNRIIYVPNADSNYVSIDGVKIVIPKEDELRKKGNLF